MPIPSPFHPRTSALCTSLRYKDWAGYHAVCTYDTHPDQEYFAFRHAAGLIDVTPLFKYEVTGPDAARFLSRVTVRDVFSFLENLGYKGQFGFRNRLHPLAAFSEIVHQRQDGP